MGKTVRAWAMGLVLLLAAASAYAQETPIRGGTLVFGVNAGDPPTYDCHASSIFTIIHLLSPHYSNLLRIDPANYPKVVGDLAESWTLSPDRMQFTFTLRDGVLFHDGSTLTSADVKASYDRIRNPPPGVVSLRRGQLATVAEIETPDPRTVVFKLNRPDQSLIYTLASPFNCVFSAKMLREDPDYPVRKVMGTGPFRFVRHVNGASWEGVRNPTYFKPGLPYLDGFRAQFVPGSAIVNALQGGQVMADFRSLTPADRDRLLAGSGDRLMAEETPWSNSLLLVFQTQHKPFDDARVRRALSLAIDRYAGSAALSKGTILGPVGGLLRPGYDLAATPEELAAIPGFGRDIAANRAEARRLLAEAGVPALKFRIVNRSVPNPYLSAAVFLIDQWRQIGVSVENAQMPDSAYNTSINEGSFDVAIDFQGDAVDEPDFQLARYQSSSLSDNRARYTDPVIDDLYRRQSQEIDPAKRRVLLRAFETRFLTEAYNVPILWWKRIVIRDKRIQGWTMLPSHLIGQDLETVWLKP